MRLLLVGNIPVDLVLRVQALPAPGADVVAESTATRPGGAFHVAVAARQGGLRCCYAGAHGQGPYGDLVRRGLHTIGASTRQVPLAGRDTGLVLVLVDASGERTFVTAPDAVVPYPQGVLDELRTEPGDLVYVSGYSLGLGDDSLPLAHWVSALPPEVPVFCDLGPRGAGLSPPILAPAFARVDWLSCNRREAALLTGLNRTADACAELSRRTAHAGVLVRAGAEGCWLALPGAAPELVSTPRTSGRIDSTGAGDTHSGAFLAALAAGAGPRDAVATANAAAARHVSA